ncbi:flavodoxin [Clostridium perfringens]|uniref:flavodoxin n=1 Tax=Clostridium perfringens TaxID=1502 RepID=UPI0010948F83|nr:flavodoxin [Clostridium perfringens]MDU5039582.1 flavodoxin [Clostridium perfringens]TGY45457.1 flavodoxin [Clostridium perfringens]
MSKVSVIYWSNGGNVEVLANTIADELTDLGAEVLIKHVSNAKVEDMLEADAVALGSPSMDNNRIEQYDMEPFVNQFKLTPNNNKKMILFGSYGWDNGEFMVEWVKRMKDYGFDVVGSLAVNESPNDDEINSAKELAKKLIK